jgi:hypothetical protein
MVFSMAKSHPPYVFRGPGGPGGPGSPTFSRSKIFCLIAGILARLAASGRPQLVNTAGFSSCGRFLKSPVVPKWNRNPGNSWKSWKTMGFPMGTETFLGQLEKKKWEELFFHNSSQNDD